MNKQTRLINAVKYLKNEGVIHTQKDIAEAMRASKSNVSSALNGVESVLTDRFLFRFAEAYKNISYNWLLTGEGSMLKPTPTQQSSGDNSPNVMGNNNMVGNTITTTHAPAQVYAQENAVRPIVPVELYKKPNTDIYNEIVKKPSSGIEYAQYFRSFSDFCMYMRVQGDAMSPNFIRGDLLALSLLNATYIINGTIYVLDTRSYGLVLRVVIDKGDFYECHSLGDEKRYAPFSIPKSDVIRIYQVMGLIRTCVS
jgi:phage repressor protein C with HTH and peptisase S24 domain